MAVDANYPGDSTTASVPVVCVSDSSAGASGLLATSHSSASGGGVAAWSVNVGLDADDWGDADDSAVIAVTTLSAPAVVVTALSLSSQELSAPTTSTCAAAAVAPVPPASASTPSELALRPFYLVWAPEPEKPRYDYAHEMELLRQYEQRAQEDSTEDDGGVGAAIAAGGGGGGGDGEEYEQGFKGADKVLRKFVKRVEREPVQCVRYSPTLPFPSHPCCRHHLMCS